MYRELAKDFVKAIKDHPFLILTLVGLQLIYFVGIGYLAVTYFTRILEDFQGVIGPLQQANYDETLLRQGAPFMENPFALLARYTSLISTIKKLIFFQLGLFLVCGTLLWAITHRLFERVDFLRMWGQLVVRAGIFVLTIVLVVHFLFRETLTEAENLSFSSLYIGIGVAVVSVYLTVFSLGLGYGDFRGLLRRTFSLLMRSHLLAPVLLVNGIAVAGAGYIMTIAAQDWPFVVMVICVFIFVVATVAARILFVGATRRLEAR